MIFRLEVTSSIRFKVSTWNSKHHKMHANCPVGVGPDGLILASYKDKRCPILSLLNGGGDSISANITKGEYPDRVYGIFLCRGDVKHEACQKFIGTAGDRIVKNAPSEKRQSYVQAATNTSNRNYARDEAKIISMESGDTRVEAQPPSPDHSTNNGTKKEQEHSQEVQLVHLAGENLSNDFSNEDLIGEKGEKSQEFPFIRGL
ncbi:unnamed protein product [Ilex paraguariensis]|uniref:Gnk2-homologous domain-containing protein n=1 Tax=Ilex paraguariensis TaxID=185542 RepID=A0ABC8TQ05_9AQUA